MSAENPASTSSWRETLRSRIADGLAQEIDAYETQIQLRKAGRIDEKVFAETRLRRGVYGQRYDNGQRHDGIRTRRIEFPSGDLTKGPETCWDAPGMMRIKIPFGGLNAAQMEALAETAEEYSDSILHVTTRQDIQLHFVHIEDTPDLMRRCAAVGITTREACGNTVRNVTACPIAGVCRDEAFDVTPYARACAYFLLGHRDTQDFGRKFKVAFSGCSQHACGLARMHDVGAVARIRVVDGIEKRGFELFVGGGLGAVPYQAQCFDEFLPEEEMLPTTQAIARVFARLGEKKNRAAARLKFLVKKLGFEEFKRLVREERAGLPPDARWSDWLAAARSESESALLPSSVVKRPSAAGDLTTPFGRWCATNVYRQRQGGYSAVTVTLPLGDLTARQMRRLADLARKYVKETVRTTVEQNLLFRWIRDEDLAGFHQDLEAIGLAESGAESIVDVTACPGTDTCKLGMASSRGLAAVLRERLMARELQFDASVRNLRIKVSGCFNSCGQHHVADIGFYGSSRTVKGFAVPHFQVLLGGAWSDNAAAYGLAIGAVPSKRIPEVVDRLLARYLEGRQANEKFREFYARVGKKDAREMLQDLTQIPEHDQDPSIYADWADSREFTIGDLGTGECAGEVVSVVDFDLASAEQKVFDAQLLLEDLESGHRVPDAAAILEVVTAAHAAMLVAARGLVRVFHPDVSDAADVVVEEFRRRYYDTQLFFDRFSGGRFAQFLFTAHDSLAARSFDGGLNVDLAHRRVEEAQLFIEHAHTTRRKMVDPAAVMAAHPLLQPATQPAP
jgi:sulfite reductase (ferredoxin)